MTGQGTKRKSEGISRRALPLAVAGAFATVSSIVLLRHFRRRDLQPEAGSCNSSLRRNRNDWKAIERQTVTPAVFPLRPIEGRRYLFDAAGSPFLMVGDSAWSLLTQLTTDDAELYLDDRQERGFNTLLVNLLEHKFADHAPRNAYGEGPFTSEGDFASINERYFDHVEQVLQSATKKGFLLLLAPAYTGANGGDEGWYREMSACGADKMREYGRYVGNRFRKFNNIIWVNVGDYNPPDKKLGQAVADGIRELLPASLHTAHNAPGTSGAGYWGINEIPIAIDTLYTLYESISARGLAS